MIKLVQTCVDCGERASRAAGAAGCAVLVTGPGEPAESWTAPATWPWSSCWRSCRRGGPPHTTCASSRRACPFFWPPAWTKSRRRARGPPGGDRFRGRVERRRRCGRGRCAARSGGWASATWPRRVGLRRGHHSHRAIVRLAAPSVAWLLGLGGWWCHRRPARVPGARLRRPLDDLAGDGQPTPEERSFGAPAGWRGSPPCRSPAGGAHPRPAPAQRRLRRAAVAAALAERAALACRGTGLAGGGGAHTSTRASCSARWRPAGARRGRRRLDQLRESERLRGVMVADLLRTFSRPTCCAEAGARRGAGSARAGSGARARAGRRSCEIAAEEDIAALLS